ncbi:MAG: acyltransferase family protein [Blautia sp.]|nr:acyltransferase family protein [Lachnoclostridium sp.]MCM1210373.1 acyltransferase family protein [Blautia sp.]
MQEAITKEKEYNMTFCILSGIAMMMIVAGHVGYDILTFNGLFPYYSFHVPLFLFISGYFYKEREEEAPLAYCKRKIKKLLLPYFIWNLFYGILAWALRFRGFSIGSEISLRTLFLEPFISGYQFLYNYAAWFVPTLFIIEMMNLLMRLILRKLRLYYEGLMLVGSLLVGMCVIWLAIHGHVWGLYKMPGRILLLYPCFQMGRFYAQKLEQHDTLGNLPYFSIVIGVQVLLNVCCNGLAYSCVWCTGFANGPVIPYVTAVSGIAFWLRTARIVTPLLAGNPYVTYLGKNTYAVMMHHVLVFMGIKALIAALAANTAWFADFDRALYLGDIDYYYLIRGAEHFKMVYLLAGVILPLLLQYGLDCLWKKRRKQRGGLENGV